MDQILDLELATMLEQIRAELADLSVRVKRLEAGVPMSAERPAPAPEGPIPEETIAEETLLAISAAVAAYLGERVHIRQIRLISSPAWAQQGRAFIQASHQVH